MSDNVCGTAEADEHEDQNWSHHKRSDVLTGTVSPHSHTHTRISFMLQTEAFVFLLVFADTQSGAKNVVPIFHQQVLPSIANAHPAVRNMAVVCLGTCTLHSKELAKTHMVLLLQVNAK